MLRDIEISEVGMGCMAFSHGYGQIPPEKYSNGMLLSALHKEDGEEKLNLLMVDPHIPAGAKLY